MGIEDLNGILKNIAADKKQQIRDAIVDGRISEQDAKKIGLSGEEQRALNEAFARGEVLVDDLFVKNLGEEYSDGRAYQLTHTGTRKNIKVEGSPYYAVYEFNHNTREATVKFYDAMSKEINVQEFAKATGLDPNGKYGVKDGFLVAINDGEENNDKNDSGQNTLTTLLATTGAGAAAGAIGGSTLMGIGALPGAAVGAFGGLVMGIFTSCSPEEPTPHNYQGGDINVVVNSKQEITLNVDVHADVSGLKSYIDAILAKFEQSNTIAQSTLDSLKELIINLIAANTKLDNILAAIGDNKEILKQILDAITKGNKLLEDVKKLMQDNNKTQKEILATTLEILSKLNNIEKAIDNLEKKFPGLSAQLTAILNAIKNNQGGTADPTAILAKLDKVIALLEAIANSSKVTEATTKAILDAINKLSADQAANFVKVINAINNLGNKLTNLQPLLDEILEAINNNTKNDDKNAQLILDAIANLKLSGGNVDLSTVTQLLKDIKDMFSNCLGKFNTLLAKLENYHGDIVDLLNKILDAIKNHTCNCNCGNGSHEGILDDINGLIS